MTIACEWGRPALRRLRSRCDVLILVDVLSFCTSVDIVLSRGSSVLPYDDPGRSVLQFAEGHQAVVAGPRGGQGPTVSPSSLTTLAAGTRLVLPTGGGGSVRLAHGRSRLFAACFRNRSAVAQAARRLGGSIALVPVGESWPDDEGWRFAVEDWLAAGAILEALGGERGPEAQAAWDAWQGARSGLRAVLEASRSGQRLARQGFGGDLDLAAAVDASTQVPILDRGAFTPPTDA